METISIEIFQMLPLFRRLMLLRLLLLLQFALFSSIFLLHRRRGCWRHSLRAVWSKFMLVPIYLLICVWNSLSLPIYLRLFCSCVLCNNHQCSCLFLALRNCSTDTNNFPKAVVGADRSFHCLRLRVLLPPSNFIYQKLKTLWAKIILITKLALCWIRALCVARMWSQLSGHIWENTMHFSLSSALSLLASLVDGSLWFSSVRRANHFKRI